MKQKTEHSEVTDPWLVSLAGFELTFNHIAAIFKTQWNRVLNTGQWFLISTIFKHLKQNEIGKWEIKK